jgi:hypothetical protein
MARKYKFFKAGAMPGREVQDLTIEIDSGFPEDIDTANAKKRHEVAGHMMAALLWETLPGGTIDQLVIALLERHASVLRVAHAAPPAPPSQDERCYGVMTEWDSREMDGFERKGPLVWEAFPMTKVEAEQRAARTKGYGWVKVIRIATEVRLVTE